MKQKQIFIILGAIGFILLLFWAVVFILAFKNLRGSNATGEMPMVEITLCDEDASDLCIVKFGANSLNRMVINFRLPSEGYAAFYAKAKNRNTVSVYMCEVDESVPTNVYCTGLRTPLGETIDIELYTIDEDKLIARGSFLVSAIAIQTPISLPTEVPATEAPITETPATATEPPVTEPPVTDVPFIEEGSTPDPFSPPNP